MALSIAASSVLSSSGLRRYAATPAATHRACIPGSSCPVTMTTGSRMPVRRAPVGGSGRSSRASAGRAPDNPVRRLQGIEELLRRSVGIGIEIRCSEQARQRLAYRRIVIDDSNAAGLHHHGGDTRSARRLELDLGPTRENAGCRSRLGPVLSSSHSRRESWRHTPRGR